MFKALVSGMAAAAFFLAAAPSVSSDPARAENRLGSVARACSTPEQLALFLSTHVIFEEDRLLFGQADYWQAPEEVLARGRGDCEDFALLACDLLSRQGKEAFLFSLYGEGGYAHTVCIFKDGGCYSIHKWFHI